MRPWPPPVSNLFDTLVGFIKEALHTVLVVGLVVAVLLLVVLGLIELIGSKPPAQPEVAGHP
jgi:hypothetical protein